MATKTLEMISILIYILVMVLPKDCRSSPTNNSSEDKNFTIYGKNQVLGTKRSMPRSDERSEDEMLLKDKENVPAMYLTSEQIIKYNLWPNGIIPYYIDVVSFIDKTLRDKIRQFLNRVNVLTDIRFDELPSPPTDEQTRWVMFLNRRGLQDCADHSVTNFTKKGVQKVVLGYDCLNTGGELAEAVLSLAGVPAQHNAPNRDDYITVIEKNIDPDKKYLFEKLKDSDWLFGDKEYDSTSAGHYHPHKYSVNGRATIELKANAKVSMINENKVFSSQDILKLRMLYHSIIRKKDQKKLCKGFYHRNPKYHKNIQKKQPLYVFWPRPPDGLFFFRSHIY